MSAVRTFVAQQESSAGASLFARAWSEVVGRYETLTLPRHIVLLNGPPGAGKAETTPAAKSALGIDYSLEMSALLRADPEAQAAMASGGLVSDARSCVALLHALVDPARSCRRGCIVDGFPRSPFQVSFVQALQARLQRTAWPAPTHFTSVLLSVSESTSLNRQLQRFETALWHEVFGQGAQGADRQRSGIRRTDGDAALRKKRYALFEQHRHALAALQSSMPVVTIDANGSAAQCQQAVAEQLVRHRVAH